MCTCPFSHVRHYWWKQSFPVFRTGFDRPPAGLRCEKNVLSYPSRHILSQHLHSHRSECVAQGHQGRQNCQHSKNDRKAHKLHQRSSHSAPYKPHGVGTRKQFFSSKLKKPKDSRFSIPKRGGQILTPHLPENLQKVVFKCGEGSRGGPAQNFVGGVRLLDKIMFSQGVDLTIQPLGVGYANRPKKTQNGGYVAFSPYICLPGFDLITFAR